MLIALSLVAVSCEDRPEGVVSKGKMEDVLYDYHIAQGVIGNISYEERGQANKYINAVFEKNGITEAEFDSSMVYYNRHAEDLKDIYKNLNERFEDDANTLQLQSGGNEMIAKYSLDGDTADIWNGRKLYILRNSPYLNRQTFTFKADSTFRRNDHFVFTAEFDFIRENMEDRDHFLWMALTVRYKDGKSISSVRQSYNLGKQEINLQCGDNKPIEKIFGYFYYQGKSGTRNLGLVTDIHLMRMHTQPAETINGEEMGDTLVSDSLVNDSTEYEGAMGDDGNEGETPKIKKGVRTTADDGKTFEYTRPTEKPRLSPEELRKMNIDTKTNSNIKTAPAVRTPNSIGPRRRIKANQQSRS